MTPSRRASSSRVVAVSLVGHRSPGRDSRCLLRLLIYYRRMETIRRSVGVNRSEALLAQLCDRAFLPLWCYPNLFRGKGKELADVVIVFGDDVILISDKACAYPETGKSDVDWQRWKSKSIDSAVDQLRRAENWLRKYPTEVYLDAKCTRPFPLTINPGGRFHRVLVARNAKDRCSKAYPGSGSLVIHSPIVPMPEAPAPFQVYLSEYANFIHVLDDVTLPILLSELDTAADFIDYLAKKEAAFSPGHIASSAGEEETLAVFLASTLHWAKDTQERAFPETNAESPIVILPGHWEALRGSKAYESKKRADQVSYLWDGIIHAFGSGLLRGEAPNPFNLSFTQLETIGRYLASESRLERRLLAAAMVDARRRVTEDNAFNRTVLSRHRPALAYILSFVPRLEQSDEEYRQFRREHALLYASHTLRRLEEIEEVVVIATDSEEVEKHSFDFALVLREDSDPEFDALVAEAAEEYGWESDRANLEWQPMWNREFPGVLDAPGTAKTRRELERRKRQKRRAQREVHRNARRRNR